MIPSQKVIFLGSITGSPHEEDFDMPFIVPNIFIQFVSAFEHNHDFSKIGEGKSHCLVMYVLRKELEDDEVLVVAVVN